MKKIIAIIVTCLTLINSNGFASDHQKPTRVAKAPHSGDTIFPGSPEWVHAGSPRSSITGDSITLICGTDGKLHPLGYAVEDTDGSWVGITPENIAMIEDHKELVRLKVAVRQIMLDMPDRKIIKIAGTLEQQK